jgi:hypothetical protein
MSGCGKKMDQVATRSRAQPQSDERAPSLIHRTDRSHRSSILDSDPKHDGSPESTSKYVQPRRLNTNRPRR